MVLFGVVALLGYGYTILCAYKVRNLCKISIFMISIFLGEKSYAARNGRYKISCFTGNSGFCRKTLCLKNFTFFSQLTHNLAYVLLSWSICIPSIIIVIFTIYPVVPIGMYYWKWSRQNFRHIWALHKKCQIKSKNQNSRIKTQNPNPTKTKPKNQPKPT